MKKYKVIISDVSPYRDLMPKTVCTRRKAIRAAGTDSRRLSGLELFSF